MDYSRYKETIKWLAGVISAGTPFADIQEMVIVSLVAEAFEKGIEEVASDIIHEMLGV